MNNENYFDHVDPVIAAGDYTLKRTIKESCLFSFSFVHRFDIMSASWEIALM